MMKFYTQLLVRIALAALIATSAIIAKAQTAIHDATITGPATDPDASAVLDAKSTNKGMLVPRMTQAQRNAIGSPANSLLIYQTDNTPGYYYWDQPSTTWQRLALASGQITVGTSGVGLGVTGSPVSLGGTVTITSNATSSNTANTVVSRDASGNFSAGQVNANLNGQWLRIDDRIIEPNSITSGHARFGFTSWNNNNSSPYADFIHLRSYTDASGGNDNLIMLSKSGIAMRVWQQSWNSGTPYSSYKTVAFVEDIGNFSGLANPTATIGLTAVNGSATTAMRSDAAPALSQAIVPTWTGTHTFNNGTYSALFTGGNVGINVATPIKKLDILTGTSSEGMVVRSATTATNVAGHLWPGSGGFVIDARLGNLTGAANLHLRTNAADRLFIQGSNGNVGISTTGPTQKLDVDGQVRIRGGSPALGRVLTSDANGVGTWSNNPSIKPPTSTFTVDGSFSEFYPVVFQDASWADGPMELEIVRSSVHTNSSWRGSLQARFWSHASQWGHGSQFIDAQIHYGTQTFIAGYDYNPYSSEFVVWLRGGGTTYTMRSNNLTTVTDFSATAKTLVNGWTAGIKTAIDAYVNSNGHRVDHDFHVNGRIKTNAINETSDIRYKKDITEVGDALDKVKRLRGVYYEWRTDEFDHEKFEEGRQIGVIAQEVEKVLPEVVTTNEAGFKSVEYSHMAPLLIEALKEQQDIIEGQQRILTSQQLQIDELRQMVLRIGEPSLRVSLSSTVP